MRAELSPAREAVLPRHGELGVGQLSGGVCALVVVEAVPGELLQILEVGTIRQGHGAPSFLVPGVRDVGRKVVMSIRSAGWFNPSRGPSAAWTALAESTSAPRQRRTTTPRPLPSGAALHLGPFLSRRRPIISSCAAPQGLRFRRVGDGADGAEDRPAT